MEPRSRWEYYSSRRTAQRSTLKHNSRKNRFCWQASHLVAVVQHPQPGSPRRHAVHPTPACDLPQRGPVRGGHTPETCTQARTHDTGNEETATTWRTRRRTRRSRRARMRKIRTNTLKHNISRVPGEGIFLYLPPASLRDSIARRPKAQSMAFYGRLPEFPPSSLSLSISLSLPFS